MIDLNNIDFRERFKYFEKDLSILLGNLDITYNRVPKKNVAPNKQHYFSFYPEELRQKVCEIYEQDFLIFNDHKIVYE